MIKHTTTNNQNIPQTLKGQEGTQGHKASDNDNLHRSVTYCGECVAGVGDEHARFTHSAVSHRHAFDKPGGAHGGVPPQIPLRSIEGEVNHSELRPPNESAPLPRKGEKELPKAEPLAQLVGISD